MNFVKYTFRLTIEQSKMEWQVEVKGTIFDPEPLKLMPNPATTSPPNASANVRKIQLPKVGQCTIDTSQNDEQRQRALTFTEMIMLDHMQAHHLTQKQTVEYSLHFAHPRLGLT